MDWRGWLCLGLAVLGLAFGLYQWYRGRRTLRRLDGMLSAAVDGSFTENGFDESVPSALEARMARFLNGSASSARNLEEERGKIAALIADISHQTKTPIANLLLYASLLAEGELSPEQREQAEAIREQAEKLSFLVEALVKSSRLDSGILAMDPVRCPVGELLEEAAAPGAGPAVRPLLPGGGRPGPGGAWPGAVPDPAHFDQPGGLCEAVLPARAGERVLPVPAAGVAGRRTIFQK